MSLTLKIPTAAELRAAVQASADQGAASDDTTALCSLIITDPSLRASAESFAERGIPMVAVCGILSFGLDIALRVAAAREKGKLQ